MTKRLKLTTALALLAVPLLAAAPADANNGAAKNEMQVQGYIGKMAKTEFSRSVWNRMNEARARRVENRLDRVVMWHEVLLDSIAIDHTPDFDTGEVPFIQGGPGRTSRALAMTQIAVYDALACFKDEKFVLYSDIDTSLCNEANRDAAIAAAAHKVLVELFPNQANRLNVILADDIRSIDANPRRIERGIAAGEAAAQAIIDERASDNSDDPEPNFGEGGRVADGSTTFFGTPVNGGTSLVGEWEPDPNTPEFSGDFNLSLGAFWGGVTPFALEAGNQFRIPAPPAPGTQEFIDAYNEVAAIGGSPENRDRFIPSTSTPETRFIGNFWGYDAVPLLGTPPRLYNQIAVQVALEQGIESPMKMARLLARINTALGDSGIAAWDSKWFYNYWRPVTGIRRNDGVAETTRDRRWDPVGVSIVNVELPEGQDFIRPTPPFPAYPSGHATFGAATFEILRRTFGDDVPFTFISDEYNGQGVDPIDPSVPRPLVPVRFSNFTEAQEENGISRVYNGVHWGYDNIMGQRLGERIGRYVVRELDAFKRIRD